MALTFNCPHCGAETIATEQALGDMVQCVNCGASVAIPTDPSQVLWTPDRDDAGTGGEEVGKDVEGGRSMARPKGYVKVVIVALMIVYPLFALMTFVNWLAAPAWSKLHTPLFLAIPALLIICALLAVGAWKRRRWGWKGLFVGQAVLAISFLTVLPIEDGIRAFIGVAVAVFIQFLVYKSEVEFLV